MMYSGEKKRCTLSTSPRPQPANPLTRGSQQQARPDLPGFYSKEPPNPLPSIVCDLTLDLSHFALFALSLSLLDQTLALVQTPTVIMVKTQETIRAEHAPICRLGASGVKFQQIADMLGRKLSTVQSIVRRARLRVESGTGPKKTGRPNKPCRRDERALRRAAYRNRWGALAGTIADSGLHISEPTARKCLLKAGASSRLAIVKPFLSRKHCQARLAFAKAHVSWTPEHWEHVIWTDESSFQTGQLHGRPCVWRRSKDELRPNCLVPSFRSARPSPKWYGVRSTAAGSYRNWCFSIQTDAMHRDLLIKYTMDH